MFEGHLCAKHLRAFRESKDDARFRIDTGVKLLICDSQGEPRDTLGEQQIDKLRQVLGSEGRGDRKGREAEALAQVAGAAKVLADEGSPREGFQAACERLARLLVEEGVAASWARYELQAFCRREVARARGDRQRLREVGAWTSADPRCKQILGLKR